MIRHGSSCTMVSLMADWPMVQRMPVPGLPRAKGISAGETNAMSHVTPPEITSIGSSGALPDRQRSPTRTIPKPLYP